MAQKAIGPTFAAELATAGLMGLAFSWDDAGGIVFGPTMTTEQTAAVEAVYAAHNPDAIPPLAPDQVLAEKIAAGITITSTGTPALNATYALDDVSTSQISQLGLYANAFGTFPGGATQPYPDVAGVPHVFTVVQFVAFLRAVAPLVSALNTQAGIMRAGGSPDWPAPTAVIP